MIDDNYDIATESYKTYLLNAQPATWEALQSEVVGFHTKAYATETAHSLGHLASEDMVWGVDAAIRLQGHTGAFKHPLPEILDGAARTGLLIRQMTMFSKTIVSTRLETATLNTEVRAQRLRAADLSKETTALADNVIALWMEARNKNVFGVPNAAAMSERIESALGETYTTGLARTYRDNSINILQSIMQMSEILPSNPRDWQKPGASQLDS